MRGELHQAGPGGGRGRQGKVEEATSDRDADGRRSRPRPNASTRACPAPARARARPSGMARRGVTTVVERIDPGTLAELIIKATALQEMTNKALRTKGRPTGSPRSRSPPRSRPASPSPSARIDEPEEHRRRGPSRRPQLVDQRPTAGEVVIALDGTTIDEATAAGLRRGGRRPGRARVDAAERGQPVRVSLGDREAARPAAPRPPRSGASTRSPVARSVTSIAAGRERARATRSGSRACRAARRR